MEGEAIVKLSKYVQIQTFHMVVLVVVPLTFILFASFPFLVRMFVQRDCRLNSIAAIAQQISTVFAKPSLSTCPAEGRKIHKRFVFAHPYRLYQP